MKNFLSGSGLILLLMVGSGCSVSVFNGLRPRHGVPVTVDSWFKPDTGHFLFNTRIELMKKHYSGLTVIKSDSSGSYRMVMITEVGLKLLDMELPSNGQTPRVYYVMDALNRKALIRTLSSDLNLVLMNGYLGLEPRLLEKRKSGTEVTRYRKKCRKYDYYLQPDSRFPETAVYTSGIRKKVKADYFGNPRNSIDSVKLEHTGLKLKIELYRIR